MRVSGVVAELELIAGDVAAGEVKVGAAMLQRWAEALRETRPRRWVRLLLPLPPKELTPNEARRGAHWSKRSKPYKSYRETTEWAARELQRKGPMWDSATVQAVFYHPHRRNRDDDNLNASLKSARDGLQGWLVIDDHKITMWPPIQRLDKDTPRVELVCMQGSIHLDLTAWGAPDVQFSEHDNDDEYPAL